MDITRRELLRCLGLGGAALLAPWPFRKNLVFAQKLSLTYGAHPAPEVYAFTGRNWTSKYGLDRKVEWFVNGGESAKAMLAGKVDTHIGGAGRIVSLSAVEPGKISQIFVFDYGDLSGFLVRPDSPYQSMEDLKGKKVGVTIGSGAYMCWMIWLDDNGFRLEDFQIVNIGGSEIPAALSQGMIEGAAVWEPYPSIMEYKGLGKIITLFGKSAYDAVVVEAKTDVVERNRQAFIALIAGMLDCQEWMRKNPTESAKVTSTELAKSGVDVPWQAFDTMLRERTILYSDFDVVERNLNKLAKVALKIGRIKSEPVFTFRRDLLKEAQKLRERK